MLTGVVRQTRGGVYRVALDGGELIEASLRGRLKREPRTGGQVVIGDEVSVESDGEGSYTIEAVGERTSQIVRRTARGRRVKIVAANVDRMIAVFAVRDPEPAMERIDRLLVIAEADGIPAALVINKVDLPETGVQVRELSDLYRSIGYPVLCTSAAEGTGLDELSRLLSVGSSALVGPSGAGKSSLLNAVEPDLGLRTGELSRKLARGRQTTVSARLIELSNGGLVADTPGFGDVWVWGVAEEDLATCFPEFGSHVTSCRFGDCAHMAEPDCGVRRAVEAGEIPESRYLSYLALRTEAGGGGRGE